MSCGIQIATLVVSILALGVLCYYAELTRRISRAALEQAEAMQKPCLVLDSINRPGEDAITSSNGIRGDLVLAQNAGRVVIRNIGIGPAVNIDYTFEKVNDPRGTPAKSEGSIHAIPPSEKQQTHAPHGIFPAYQFECIVTYQSLSKRKYETRISVNDAVLGEFQFKRIG